MEIGARVRSTEYCVQSSCRPITPLGELSVVHSVELGPVTVDGVLAVFRIMVQLNRSLMSSSAMTNPGWPMNELAFINPEWVASGLPIGPAVQYVVISDWMKELMRSTSSSKATVGNRRNRAAKQRYNTAVTTEAKEGAKHERIIPHLARAAAENISRNV